VKTDQQDNNGGSDIERYEEVEKERRQRDDEHGHDEYDNAREADIGVST
jgi:hypothetical protein